MQTRSQTKQLLCSGNKCQKPNASSVCTPNQKCTLPPIVPPKRTYSSFTEQKPVRFSERLRAKL